MPYRNVSVYTTNLPRSRTKDVRKEGRLSVVVLDNEVLPTQPPDGPVENLSREAVAVRHERNTLKTADNHSWMQVQITQAQLGPAGTFMIF